MKETLVTVIEHPSYLRRAEKLLTPAQKVHVLDIYGKGEKANLTKTERNELAKLAEILKREKP